MRNPSVSMLLGLLGVLSLAVGCDRQEGGPGQTASADPGKVIVSLLPAVQGGTKGEEVGVVAASIRRRLGLLGFEGVEVKTLPDDELLVRFSSAPASGGSPLLMQQAFDRLGLLEVKRLHPESKALTRDIRLLAAAGPEWGVAHDDHGGGFVMAEEPLLPGGWVEEVEISNAAAGEGFDVVAMFGPRGSRILGNLKAGAAGEALALLLDGRVLEAPLSPSAIVSGPDGRGGILVVRGVSEAEARELAFILEAPLVVPLQIKGDGAM